MDNKTSMDQESGGGAEATELEKNQQASNSVIEKRNQKLMYLSNNIFFGRHFPQGCVIGNSIHWHCPLVQTKVQLREIGLSRI